MSYKKFWLSVLAVWLVKFVTDWVLHGIWLQPDYQETAQFWRPMAEMGRTMYWMWIGQAIFAWTFVWIYSKGVTQDNQWAQAFRYAMAILMVSDVPHQLGAWAVSPYPGTLIVKWFAISVVQAVLCSLAMTWTFKPATWAAPART